MGPGHPIACFAHGLKAKKGVQPVAVQLPAHRQRESLGSCKVHRTRVIPCVRAARLTLTQVFEYALFVHGFCFVLLLKKVHP